MSTLFIKHWKMAKADKDKHCTQHNVYNENNLKNPNYN